MTTRELLVDHLLYATPDVDRTVDDLEQLFGVRAAEGGRHPAWATRNALLSLGPRTYLEIFGPDEKALEPPQPRPFGIDDGLERARLATWIAPHADLGRLVHAAAGHHIDLGAVESRSRQAPDGTTLTWRMTDLRKTRAGGVVPFFIDWGDTPHPAATAPRGGSLLGLRAEHPQASEVEAWLAHLELALPVVRGGAPLLIATIATPRGVIELR
jgi:glyoxalase-like protein